MRPGRKPMIRVATVALPALLAHALAAQDAPPTFKTESQVVVLDVVARDGRGRPVWDLRVDDIEVFEDGQPCAITSFRLIRGGPAGPENAAATGAPATPAAADETSTTPSRANLVVLLFDRLSVTNAAAARRGALDLLSRRFPADTWFAVYKVDRSGMRALQPFTSDAGQLVAAVERATSGDEASRVAGPAGPSTTPSATPSGPSDAIPARPDLPRGPATRMVQVASGVEREVQDLAARLETFDSLYAIAALTRGLSEIRGRKTILYLAEDIEAPESAAHVYDATIAAANRANVTVHTVDTRGLVSTRPGDRGGAGGVLEDMRPSAPTGGSRTPGTMAGALWAPSERGDGPGGPMTDRTAVLANPVQGSFLAHVAHDTGGLAISGTNDLSAGMARAADEVGQYYEVAYEPPRPEPDGRFRRITAKALRKDVRLHTRSGYFANTGSSPAISAFQLPLLAAIGAAEPPKDFAHAATVMHFASAGAERDALFLAEVSLGSTKVVEDREAGTYRAHLALLGLVRDEEGRPVARFSQDWPIEGPLAERARLAETTASFRRSLTLPPGGYTLVTAIHDREANKTSVERSRFDVPPAEAGLALGSLAVIRTASGAPAMGADPFRVGGVSIAPHVGSAELPTASAEVRLFMPIYPAPVAAPVELQIEVRRAGDTVVQSTPQLPAAGPEGRIAWIGGLPTKGFPPGEYEVVATVRQGDVVAEERGSFDLREPGPAGSPADIAATTPPPVPEDLVPVLEAAARYVLEYEEAFQNITTDETYTQWVGAVAPVSYVTKAHVVFARLAGPVSWGCFRDVYEVQGQKVRDPNRRLEALFTRLPVMTAAERATALLAESARYNQGAAVRNINFPTLALAFLHPMNQGRFAWSRGGRRRFGSVEGVEVKFEEIARPTIVDRGGDGNLPAAGRFWIHPELGTVLRSETSFRFMVNGVRSARAFVATEYRPEPKLAMWVPTSMREEYEDLPAATVRTFGGRTVATARYGGFRRFTVTTEVETQVPADDPVPR